MILCASRSSYDLEYSWSYEVVTLMLLARRIRAILKLNRRVWVGRIARTWLSMSTDTGRWRIMLLYHSLEVVMKPTFHRPWTSRTLTHLRQCSTHPSVMCSEPLVHWNHRVIYCEDTMQYSAAFLVCENVAYRILLALLHYNHKNQTSFILLG